MFTKPRWILKRYNANRIAKPLKLSRFDQECSSKDLNDLLKKKEMLVWQDDVLNDLIDEVVFVLCPLNIS